MLTNFLTKLSESTLKRVEHAIWLAFVAFALLITPVAVVTGIFVGLFAAGCVFIVCSATICGLLFLMSKVVDVRDTHGKKVLYVLMKS